MLSSRSLCSLLPTVCIIVCSVVYQVTVLSSFNSFSIVYSVLYFFPPVVLSVVCIVSSIVYSALYYFSPTVSSLLYFLSPITCSSIVCSVLYSFSLTVCSMLYFLSPIMYSSIVYSLLYYFPPTVYSLLYFIPPIVYSSLFCSVLCSLIFCSFFPFLINWFEFLSEKSMLKKTWGQVQFLPILFYFSVVFSNF